MIPKDKAKELVERLCKGAEDPNRRIGKQCALICVEVILNDVGAKDWENDLETNTNYWIEVKQEIEKL